MTAFRLARPFEYGHATIVDKRDHWSIKRGHQCETLLQTDIGVADNFSSGMCAQMPWDIGQSIEVHLRKGRITRWLFVYGGGLEIERGASTVMLRSSP